MMQVKAVYLRNHSGHNPESLTARARCRSPNRVVAPGDGGAATECCDCDGMRAQPLHLNVGKLNIGTGTSGMPETDH